MSRQGNDNSGKPRKVSVTRAPEESPMNPSTGAPLVIAVILIAAIAIGLGYSLFKRNHEPSGIAMPAGTAMDSAPAPVGSAGSAAPADSAQPQRSTSYGANTLIN